MVTVTKCADLERLVGGSSPFFRHVVNLDNTKRPALLEHTESIVDGVRTVHDKYEDSTMIPYAEAIEAAIGAQYPGMSNPYGVTMLISELVVQNIFQHVPCTDCEVRLYQQGDMLIGVFPFNGNEGVQKDYMKTLAKAKKLSERPDIGKVIATVEPGSIPLGTIMTMAMPVFQEIGLAYERGSPYIFFRYKIE